MEALRAHFYVVAKATTYKDATVIPKHMLGRDPQASLFPNKRPREGFPTEAIPTGWPYRLDTGGDEPTERQESGRIAAKKKRPADRL
jgi:hypothetical protein